MATALAVPPSPSFQLDQRYEPAQLLDPRRSSITSQRRQSRSQNEETITSPAVVALTPIKYQGSPEFPPISMTMLDPPSPEPYSPPYQTYGGFGGYHQNPFEAAYIPRTYSGGEETLFDQEHEQFPQPPPPQPPFPGHQTFGETGPGDYHQQLQYEQFGGEPQEAHAFHPEHETAPPPGDYPQQPHFAQFGGAPQESHEFSFPPGNQIAPESENYPRPSDFQGSASDQQADDEESTTSEDTESTEEDDGITFLVQEPDDPFGFDSGTQFGGFPPGPQFGFNPLPTLRISPFDLFGSMGVPGESGLSPAGPRITELSDSELTPVSARPKDDEPEIPQSPKSSLGSPPALADVGDAESSEVEKVSPVSPQSSTEARSILDGEVSPQDPEPRRITTELPFRPAPPPIITTAPSRPVSEVSKPESESLEAQENEDEDIFVTAEARSSVREQEYPRQDALESTTIGDASETELNTIFNKFQENSSRPTSNAFDWQEGPPSPFRTAFYGVDEHDPREFQKGTETWHPSICDNPLSSEPELTTDVVMDIMKALELEDKEEREKATHSDAPGNSMGHGEEEKKSSGEQDGQQAPFQPELGEDQAWFFEQFAGMNLNQDQAQAGQPENQFGLPEKAGNHFNAPPQQFGQPEQAGNQFPGFTEEFQNGPGQFQPGAPDQFNPYMQQQQPFPPPMQYQPPQMHQMYGGYPPMQEPAPFYDEGAEVMSPIAGPSNAPPPPRITKRDMFPHIYGYAPPPQFYQPPPPMPQPQMFQPQAPPPPMYDPYREPQNPQYPQAQENQTGAPFLGQPGNEGPAMAQPGFPENQQPGQGLVGQAEPSSQDPGMAGGFPQSDMQAPSGQPSDQQPQFPGQPDQSQVFPGQQNPPDQSQMFPGPPEQQQQMFPGQENPMPDQSQMYPGPPGSMSDQHQHNPNEQPGPFPGFLGFSQPPPPQPQRPPPGPPSIFQFGHPQPAMPPVPEESELPPCPLPFPPPPIWPPGQAPVNENPFPFGMPPPNENPMFYPPPPMFPQPQMPIYGGLPPIVPQVGPPPEQGSAAETDLWQLLPQIIGSRIISEQMMSTLADLASKAASWGLEEDFPVLSGPNAIWEPELEEILLESYVSTPQARNRTWVLYTAPEDMLSCLHKVHEFMKYVPRSMRLDEKLPDEHKDAVGVYEMVGGELYFVVYAGPRDIGSTMPMLLEKAAQGDFAAEQLAYETVEHLEREFILQWARTTPAMDKLPEDLVKYFLNIVFAPKRRPGYNPMTFLETPSADDNEEVAKSPKTPIANIGLLVLQVPRFLRAAGLGDSAAEHKIYKAVNQFQRQKMSAWSIMVCPDRSRERSLLWKIITAQKEWRAHNPPKEIETQVPPMPVFTELENNGVAPVGPPPNLMMPGMPLEQGQMPLIYQTAPSPPQVHAMPMMMHGAAPQQQEITSQMGEPWNVAENNFAF